MTRVKLLTTKQLAERIGAHADWVEHFAGPPSIRIDGERRVRPQDIAAWKQAWAEIPCEPDAGTPLGGAL